MTPGVVFTWLGYLVGVGVLYWAARRKGVATEGMAWVAVAGITAALIGAKFAQFVAEGWPIVISFEAIFDPRLGGRALLGGVIGGWIGVEIAKRRLGIKRPTGDFFALALPAGEAIGRIGCYFNGCCYGTPFDGPWAVFQHGQYRHPAQLYSSFVSAALFGWLLWMRDRTKIEGELFRFYLLGFGASRFLLEFARWRESLWLGLSPMQWLCAELAIYASLWLWLANKKCAQRSNSLVGESS